ncbi:cobyrinate a,c-diamide synthase [Vibrio intestinalis]|uniref:cobyrinate a,c-diamide synthase n=1 Tax=Vibrio intestinalis TaxID=2933291 RepID=UPI0021A68BF3|nr:cobyrinate a,c-diamide synthase [Vibrio intestinalis]
MTNPSCPALVVAAPSSGSGKTTVVAAIARYYRNQGKQVRVFKTGPDFIDPAFLAHASGAPVYQLDFWMCGLEHCQQLLAQAAQEADLILIEGVMGMFDGQCSSADIAATLGIPVMAVIDAGAMAQTFGAIVCGLANYRSDVDLVACFANRVGSERHFEMLAESVAAQTPLLSYLPRDEQFSFPDRHLGLVQAQELDDLEQRLEAAAQSLGKHWQLPARETEFTCPEATPMPQLLAQKTIAVAKDKAFSFLYQANIDCLQSLGANIVYFSPIEGERLPKCDALYLVGGYPELHTNALVNNELLQQDVSDVVTSGLPVIAECGGMLYLQNSLTDKQGNQSTLCGVLNADSVMQPKLAALGLVESEFEPDQFMRGHSFHYSKTNTKLQPWRSTMSQHGRTSDAVYRVNNLIASYVHWYFAYNPILTAKMFLGELTQ